MALKTDYKDAMCDGARKYRITTNPDGTVGLLDVTNYTQEGDRFGANDINAVNTEVNKMQNTVVVTLSGSGWSESVPFSQKVAVPEIRASDNPEVHPYIPKELDAAAVKLRQKLTGMITDGETEDGYVTLYCGAKKPTVDFPILLKGVSTNG